ncbi:hypothetical protein [Paenibacillus sp. GP183]|uniref:hypothetical protein n=1 Tax=Paenibacillus sp. GP183 TaxID=1882751 RepID=UPI00089CB525|nr:hypothetical protein [Paenibacillus sp. GP183]SEC22431.1 hypothetical protein SAMN05443246_3398 [Paenibacillus sp. GP183]
MRRYLKSGFTMALHQPFAVILMFLYQAGWGVLLYKMIQSILLPLMHRYPGAEQPAFALKLFLAESQFQLFKTDLIQPYIWWLASLFVLRMLVTPLLNAGIYYSLAHPELNAGYRFVKGIRELSLRFFLAYIVQISLTLTPLFWLVPKFQTSWSTQSSYVSALTAIMPWLIAYLFYSYLLRLCFTYIQFTQVSRVPLLSSFSILLRHGGLILMIGIILLIFSGLLTGTVMTAAYIWTGFIALLIYQLYPFCNMFLQIWSLSAQFQLWSSKNNMQ